MKLRLYAGDLNLNRKSEKSMKKYKKMIFRKQNGEKHLFSSPKVL